MPPSSMSSSTGSLVVPATSSTRTRCCPASLFSRLDLPTVSRPGPRWAGVAAGGGAPRAGEGLPAAGIHQREGAAAPECVVGHPVAGDARGIFDHCLAAAEDPVDQGGLAHVGPSYHGHHRRRSVRAPAPLPRFAGPGVATGRPGTARGLAALVPVFARHGHLSRAVSAREGSCPGPGPPPPATGNPRSPAAWTIRLITSSRPRTVESTSIASSAITVCGASARSRRLFSSLVTPGVAPGSAARSALRREALASSLAVRDTLTTACGAATVPMSPPAATIP